MLALRSVALVLLLAAGAVAGAIAWQTAARERDYRALLARGDTALHDDQIFGAIEAYSGAVALRPDSMLARLRRGETYQRRGDLEAAARDFRDAARLDPTAPRPLEELGDVLYQMQRFARAADVYEQCLRLDDRSSRVAYKLALARYRDNQRDAAIATLMQAVRQVDVPPETYYLLGLCLRDARRPAQARQAFERAIAISPRFVPAHEELADLLAAAGRWTDAVAQLTTLAELDDRHVERRIALGLAQARAGHADPALLTLGRALEDAPDDPRVYGALGRLWLDEAESHNDRLALDKALAALDRVASNPAAPSAVLTVYGRALLRDDQVDAAERILQRATESFPVEPSSYLDYATAAERRNHLEAARQALVDYGALVADDPQLEARAVRIGGLSLRLNDPSAASHWLRRAIELNPSDVRALTALAEAELKQGDRQAARDTIARALAIEPSNIALAGLARRAR